MGRLTTTTTGKTWRRNAAALGEMQDSSKLREVRVSMLPDMQAVSARVQDLIGFRDSRSASYRGARDRAAVGSQVAAGIASEQAVSLIDDAIMHEPRLAKRSQWVRGEDGIFADAGLVASGDDSPCYYMERRSLREAAANFDPIKVAVSTDSSTKTSLAAFIATVRIVQQFRPVHIYWQGAWLADDGREAGYVFHAPVITGDMDFARLAFIVADTARDCASFAVLWHTANVCDKMSLRGLGRAADRSYLPGAHYVSAAGIAERASTIAATACKWLGIDSPSLHEYRREVMAEAGLQSIPRVLAPDTRTQAQRDAQESRWAEYDRERDEQRRRAAEDRVNQVQP